MGGIAADAGTNWRIGGKIDFTSANYSKRKDLRHTNYRLDLKVAPGIMYHSDHYAIGFSYIFSKNSESVSAEEIGTAATPYYAFLDKGLMYGAYEAWSGSGIHLSESGINGFYQGTVSRSSSSGSMGIALRRCGVSAFFRFRRRERGYLVQVSGTPDHIASEIPFRQRQYRTFPADQPLMVTPDK